MHGLVTVTNPVFETNVKAGNEMERSGLLGCDRLARLLLCLPVLGERFLSRVASRGTAMAKLPTFSSAHSKGPLRFPGSKSGSGSLP